MHRAQSILQAPKVDSFEARLKGQPFILRVRRRLETNVIGVDFGRVDTDLPELKTFAASFMVPQLFKTGVEPELDHAGA
jgi:hypothetical protein